MSPDATTTPGRKLTTRVGWVLSIGLSLLTGFAGVAKISGMEQAVHNASTWGFDARTLALLGVLQLTATALFLVPRTAIAGALLQIAYFGGAIATHLEHGLPPAAPVVIEALFWIAAFARFPDLRTLLLRGGLQR